MKPHDTLFRTMCAHRDIQQDLVRVALPELADRIRMDTVRAMPWPPPVDSSHPPQRPAHLGRPPVGRA